MRAACGARATSLFCDGTCLLSLSPPGEPYGFNAIQGYAMPVRADSLARNSGCVVGLELRAKLVPLYFSAMARVFLCVHCDADHAISMR